MEKLTFKSIIFSNSITVALAVFISKKNVHFPIGSISIYSHHRSIMPIYFSNILRAIFLYFDQVLVLLFLKIKNLGIYSKAIAIAGFSVVFTSALNSLVPSIAQQEKIDKRKFLFQLFCIYFIVVLMGSFLSHYFLPSIIDNTISRSFYPIISIIPILIFGNFLQSFVQVQISWSIFENKSKILVIEKCMHLVGLILSGIFLYQFRSLQAVVCMTIISYIPSLLFFTIKNLKNPKNFFCGKDL